MATQAILPPPPKKRIHPPKTGRFGQSSHFPTWQLVPKVPEGPDVEVTRQVRIWVKVAISPPIPQWLVLARNLFSKIGAGNFYLPYCSVKICPPLSCELWEWYSAYIVNPLLYKLRRGGIQSQLMSLHPIGNISKENRDKQEQSRPHQHTLDSKIFVVFPPKVLLHTVYIFNIFTVDWG